MTSSTNLSVSSRVVVTTHGEDGTSIFQSDEVLAPFQPFGPNTTSFSTFDVQTSVPVSNQRPVGDLGNSLPRCPPGGAVFTVANYPPQYSVPMHRTLSRDYAIVISGEIVIGLDGGEERTVKAGDFIVQGGVNHTWHNRTDNVCRIAFVMLDAEKVKLSDGRELEETVIKRD